MLQNIVHNSNQLIRSQYLDQDSVLNHLIKLKNKRKKLQHLQSSYQGSIFEQPQFNPHIQLKTINKRNKSYMTTPNNNIRTKSEETSKNLEKMNSFGSSKHKRNYHFTIDDEIKFTEPQKLKIIHSRINAVQSFSVPKSKKPHHQRAFPNKEKFVNKDQMIQEPGFTNLCFYKDTLQQINIMRSAKIQMHKRTPERKLSQRQSTGTQKKRFSTTIKRNGNEKKADYRPWSPKNDNDPVQGEFLSFKSYSLKI